MWGSECGLGFARTFHQLSQVAEALRELVLSRGREVRVVARPRPGAQRGLLTRADLQYKMVLEYLYRYGIRQCSGGYSKTPRRF